ncbi:TetR/AcrR family transcriptional regulator [Blastococcus saxobsidens]|uniref:Transcriptional regulator, TetR family n=1 Tax=Blastococcus saxobsidens (strain DD2) TaxID=1146883 RepID=H6RU01_BLASD|nr:TetR family transcriptional regulator [Blastococcus saxobsidens]CCG04411.1 Transcriptional regulator, TetR family [Blastococcus saxobsidens DD2]
METAGGDRPGRRLPRAERRDQILAAATGVFARDGFTATGMGDVATAAGISRAILYRHFDTKADLYRAVLARARHHLQDAVGEPPYTERIVDDLLRGAAADPAAFTVLFHQSGREPEFRADADRFTADMVAMAHDHLSAVIPDPAWARWAAQLAPATTIAAVAAWLDAGRPDPEHAAARIRRAIEGIHVAANADRR